MRHLTEAQRPHALTPPVVVSSSRRPPSGLLAALLGPQAEAAAPVRPATLTGTVVHVMPDRFGTAEVAGDPDDVLTFVTTPTSAVPVASDALADLPTGTDVGALGAHPTHSTDAAITPAAVSVLSGRRGEPGCCAAPRSRPGSATSARRIHGRATR